MESSIKLEHKVQPMEWVKTTILIGMSLYFFVLIFSGNLSNYINLRFAWLSYLGGFIFLGLGLWSAITLLRKRDYSDEHHHTHSHLSWRVLFVVGLPLIFAVFLPSQPLGADAISGGISLEPIGGVSAEARYDVPPIERNVLDWLRAFDTVANPAELNGLPVDIVAFVYREPEMGTTQFMAARFTLSCCVADAFAVGMPVEYADAPNLDDGAWVRIQGTLEAGDFRGGVVPIIMPEMIEPIDAPDNPYLYS